MERNKIIGGIGNLFNVLKENIIEVGLGLATMA
jgi:hypothetical protein